MSFWGELKRRNIYKVGVAYAIVAWLIIQATAIVSPALQLPSWMLPVVIIFLSIGFIVTLFLAWAFEVTPDGIKRTKEVPLSESITHLTGKKFNYILAGVIVLAVAYILFDKFYFDRRVIEKEIASIEPEQAPVVSDVQEAPKTIAVLPFTDISPEKDQEYFVDGLSEELLNSLSQIPDLLVTARTSSFSFKGTNKTVQEIANVLGVENILEGSVRKAGNALRITAQLVRAKDGFHLWSKTYNRELKDIFVVQEDIATTVADELKVTLGIDKSLKQLGGTENEKAYELYMIAKGQFRDVEPNRALESIDMAIASDLEFALAWALKSQIHQGVAATLPANQYHSELEKGFQAAQKAIELEPNLAAGYYSLGCIKTFMGDWIGAELAFGKALELITEPSLRYEVQHPFLYSRVGHLKRAKEIWEGQLRNDPLNANFRGLYIGSLGRLGDRQQAEDEYEKGIALFGDPWDWGKHFITEARLYSGDIISIDQIMVDDLINSAAKEHLESPKEGLAALHRLYDDQNNLNWFDFSKISLWAAYFGDSEFAMDAMEKAISLMVDCIEVTWCPRMHEVRQTPRFKELVKEVGLVDYWNEFGWPDICRPLDNGDFECD